MMLAEKYAFEAKRLVKDPKIEVARKQCGDVVRIRLHARATQLRQEFKHPGLDHGNVIRIPHRFPSAARGNSRVGSADDRFGSKSGETALGRSEIEDRSTTRGGACPKAADWQY